MRKLIFIFFLIILSSKGIAQLGVSPSGNRNLCSGDSLRISVTGLSSSVTYVFKWFKNGSIINDSTRSSFYVRQSGTYFAVVEYSPDKSDTIREVNVSVNPKPTANFSFTQPNGCGTKSIQFSNTSVDGSGGSNLFYKWDFGNGKTSTDKNPSMTFKPGKGSSSDVFNIKLKVTSADGCIDSITRQISIGQTPDASLDGDNPSNFNGQKYFKFCQSEAATFGFTNLSTTIGTNTSYKIKWGDNSPDSSFNSFPSGVFIFHTYPVGTKTLTFYAFSGACVDSTQYNIFIGNKPAGGIGAPEGRNICAGDSLPFFITNATANPPGTRYIFFVNDNSTPDTFYHPAPDTVRHTFKISSCGFSLATSFPNSFQAVLNISNPCNILGTEGTIKPIEVSDKPNPKISISPRDTICVGQGINFTNTGNPGSNVQDGVCTPGKSIWKIFPSTGWTLATGQSQGSTNNRTNPSSWTAGSTLLSVTFNTPGTYEIRLVMGNNTLCGSDSVVKMICVNPAPDPTLSFNNSSICVGSSISPIATLNTPTCGNYSFSWSVSYVPTAGCSPATSAYQITNANSLNPTIQFDNPGTYTVSFTAVAPGGACSTIVSKPILIRGKPSLTLPAIADFCQVNSISPTSTISCTDSVTTYVWTFQDGTPATSSSQAPGLVSFSSSGTKQVQLTVTNSCGTATQSTNVTVNPMPVVSPITGTSTLCISSQTTFTGPSGGSWSSSAPSIASVSSLGVVSGIAAGTATIRYTVTSSGCTTTVTKDITVNPLPTITLQSIPSICNTATSFTIPYTSITNNASTYDLTAGPTNILSGFTNIIDAPLNGSPLNISLAGATLNAGTYNFTLKIKNANGCSTTSSPFSLVIAAPPNTANAGSDISNCNNSTFNLAANAPSPGTGQWSFVSGTNVTINSANSPAASVTGLPTGASATLRWTISNTPCPASSDEMVITNNPAPAVTLGPIASICNTATSFSIPYSNPLNGAATYDLVAGTRSLPGFSGIIGASLGSSPLSIDLSGLTLNAGIYDFTLRIKNATSCQSAYNFSLTIVAPPSIANAGPDISQCNNGNFIMVAEAPTSGTGIWSLVSGSASIVTPSSRITNITNLASGTSATLRWTVSNNPCPASTDDIVITNNPVPAVTLGSIASICNTATSFSIPYSNPLNGAATYDLVAGTRSLPGFSGITGVSLGSSPLIVDLSGLTLNAGIYDFTLRIKNGTSCQSTNSFSLTIAAPPSIANAGPDISQCNNGIFIMAAEAPTSGAGIWSLVSGSASIVTPSSRITNITNLASGTSATLRWTVSNNPCPASIDDIVIQNIAAVGSPTITGNFINCNVDSFTLIGSSPGSGQSGSWTLVSGNANLPSDVNTQTIQINGITAGASAILRWTVSNTLCNSSKDVTISNRAPILNNVIGVDQTICGSQVNITGSTASGGGLSGVNPTLTYQWQFRIGLGSWTNIPTLVGTAKDLLNYSINQSTTFRRLVTGLTCTDTSNLSNITVQPLISNNSIGSSQILCNSQDPAELIGSQPTGGGTTNYVYEWQLNTGNGIWSKVGEGISYDPAPLQVTGNTSIIYSYRRLVSSPDCPTASPLISNVVTIQWNPDGKADFTALVFSRCAPFGITISNNINLVQFSTRNSQYNWKLINNDGSGTIIQSLDNSLTPPAYSLNLPNQSIILQLIAVGANGCKNDTIQKIFSTSDNPIVSFAGDIDSSCSPMIVKMTNNTYFGSPGNSSGLSFQWYVNGVLQSSLVSPSLTLVNPSNTNDAKVNIKLIATIQASSSCKDSTSSDFRVLPVPLSQFSIINGDTCSNENGIVKRVLNTSVSKIGNVEYRWRVTYSNGSKADAVSISDTAAFSPAFTFPHNDGSVDTTYTISLEVISADKCSKISTQNITIFREPSIKFRLSQISGCSPFTLNVVDSTNNVSHTKQWSSIANISGAPILRFSSTTISNPVITVPDNPLDTTIIYTIRQIATSISGCRDTLERTVTVFPKPKVSFTVPSLQGCAPYSLTAINTSTAGNSEPFSTLVHQWKVLKGATVFVSGTNSDLSTILTNTGIIDSTYDIWLIVTTKNGCKDSVKKTIVVHGNAKAEYATRNAVGCIPFKLKSEITLNTYSGVNSSYKWTVNGVSYPSGFTPPDYTITKDGDTAIVLLEAVSKYGCLNDFYTDTFYTIKTPIPSFVKSIDQGCGPLTVTYTNSSVPLGGVNYTWQFGNGQSSQQVQPVAVTYMASPTYRDTVYNVTLTATTTCTTVVFRDSILIRPKPLAIVAPDSTRLCSPVTVNFNNFSKGANRKGTGIIYYWNFGDGTYDTTYDNTAIKHTYYNKKAVPDTFVMKLYAVNECGIDSNSYKIVVLPNDVVSELVIDGNNKTGCAPFTVNFYNRSAGATSYKWDYGDGTTLFTTISPDQKSHVYTKAGTYSISLFATNGCSDSTTYEQVTVLDPVSPSFTTDKSAYCDYDSVRFNNTTTSLSANSFEWDFGDGTRSVSRNPIHKYSDTGLYKVILTAKNVGTSGVICQDIFIKYVRVSSRPNTKINLSSSGPFCTPFELLAKIDSQSAPIVKWIFEDGLDSDTIYNSFAAKHIYKGVGYFRIGVSIQNSAGCFDSSSAYVTISGSPLTKFSFPDSVFCVNDKGIKTINFTNQTTVPNGQTYSYQWIVDGAIVSTDRRQLSYDFVINNLAELPKNYLVTLRSLSSNGCSKDSTIRIRFVPYPKARFSVNSKINCYNSSISVSDQDKETIHTRKWSIQSIGGSPGGTLENDTASNSRIFIPLNRSGSIYSYEIKLAVTTEGRCIDSVKDTILVYPEPAILFSLPDTLCADQQELVKNLSVPLAGTTQGQMVYSWKLRRYNAARDTVTILTSSDLDLVFRTLNSGIQDSTYFITLSGVTPQGCSSSFTKKFVVKAPVKAAFTYTPSISCSPARLSITTNDSRNAAQYRWYINDQLYSVLVKPNDTILRRGGTSYTIKMLALSGNFCNNDSVSYSVVTYEPPVASFDISDTSSCTGVLQPLISDRSYGIGTDIVKWNWNFGDGTSSNVQNPIKQFNVPGRYKLSLTVQDRKGCLSDTLVKNITIFGKPKALFTVSDICIGDSILPINKSILGFGSTKFETINWSFGDGNSSTLFEPRHKYALPGEFTVRLIVYGDKSCVPDTLIQKVKVIGKPVAAVSWDIQCRLLPIQFNSLSTAGFGDQIGIFQWSWSDGEFSLLKDPIKSFRDTGRYKVKLIVSGNLCPHLKDTVEKVISISNPRSSIVYPIKYVAMQKPYQLTAEPGGLKYYWTPGTGLDNPLKKDPIAKYQLTAPGKVFYTIEITDSSGCKIFDKQEVWVFEQPDIFLPTAFTPNGDGVNDAFRPLYVNIASIKYFRIFDRRGNIIVQTADMNFEWNGTMKGRYLPMDTYTWVILAIDKDGKELFRKGNVTLIRKD